MRSRGGGSFFFLGLLGGCDDEDDDGYSRLRLFRFWFLSLYVLSSFSLSRLNTGILNFLYMRYLSRLLLPQFSTRKSEKDLPRRRIRDFFELDRPNVLQLSTSIPPLSQSWYVRLSLYIFRVLHADLFLSSFLQSKHHPGKSSK